MSNEIGISLYIQEGIERNKEILTKGVQSSIRYVFTTLNIPEESPVDLIEETKLLAKLCHDYKVNLIVDISPKTTDLLKIENLLKLKDWGISTIRIDYGYDAKEIFELSKTFEIVVNASTINDDIVDSYREEGIDLTKIIACHNYYPKEYTGLAMGDVRAKNNYISSFGIRTMTFVAGDFKRGPVYAGLPTIEAHRYVSLSEALWSSKKDLKSDIVMIGDIDLTDTNWNVLTAYHNGEVLLASIIDERYEELYGKIFHDRRDSSPYMIRLAESRIKDVISKKEPNNTIERSTGSICLSNVTYGRYDGEIEIARQTVQADKRVNVIGHIVEESLEVLKYIKDGQAFKMIKKESE